MAYLERLRYKSPMLHHLSIRNHTLIPALDLELGTGLTVITGETGAGKSIVLDALGLALGSRADARAIRTGAERLEVTAAFDLDDTPTAGAWLAERELDEDGECQLRRVVTRDGRSRAWINGRPATLQDIRELGDRLVDIHGQHEHHSLLRRSAQQHLLDEHGGHLALLRHVSEACSAWRACRDELDALHRSAHERLDRMQLLSYQLAELDELAPGPNEYEALEQEQRLLASAHETQAAIATTLTLCEGNGDSGLLDGLRRACTATHALAALGIRANTVHQLLESARIQVDEARRELTSLAEQFEADPQRLAEVESRLSMIHGAARRHRVSATALPALTEELRHELQGLDGSDARITHLEKEEHALRAAWVALAERLSGARRETARQIAIQVDEQLALLGMENCRFSVMIRPVTHADPNPEGAEQIEFLVTTNPGAAPDALSRVASGGELSRISLAIQVIIANRTTTPTVIFDEVDVGIGGATADAVGQLLQTLGARIQVVCVTHLAQVAARGAAHLRALKRHEGESTVTELQPLDDGERIEELARMLGASTITRKTTAHAREMLETAHRNSTAQS